MAHSAARPILDLTVRELLDALGSDAPTPGGGAVAALAGALGAALVQMTANLTLGRPRFAEVQDQARAIQARAADLQARLAALAEADASAFGEVSAAYKMARGTDADKAARSRAIQSALHSAAAVPLEAAQVAADVLHLAEQAAPLLNPSVISDVLVGAQLAHAALEAAALNVEVNLVTMKDEAAVARLRAQIEQTREGATTRLSHIVEVGRSRMAGSQN